MCFFLCDAVGDAARFAFAVVCCCLCVGPILVVIGIVLLAHGNTREEDVRDYNAKVDAYDAKDARILQRTSMSLGDAALNRIYTSVVIVGNVDGVTPSSHFVFETAGVTQPTGDKYVLALTGATRQNQTVQYSIPFFKAVSRPLRCARERCDRNCGNEGSSCSESIMRSYCRGSFGGTYQDNSGACYDGDECGTCSYTGNLARACVVMAFTSDGRASPSSRYANCYYPFNEHEYVPNSRAATFEVVSEDDPFIELQRVTGGKNDFGITEGEQRAAGIVCLAIGVLMTAVMIGIAVFLIRQRRKNREKYTSNDPVAGRFGDPPYVLPQQQYGAAEQGYGAGPSPNDVEPLPQVPVVGYPVKEGYEPRPSGTPPWQPRAYGPGPGYQQNQRLYPAYASNFQQPYSYTGGPP
jgi:hypothetical protein